MERLPFGWLALIANPGSLLVPNLVETAPDIPSTPLQASIPPGTEQPKIVEGSPAELEGKPKLGLAVNSALG